MGGSGFKPRIHIRTRNAQVASHAFLSVAVGQDPAKNRTDPLLGLVPMAGVDAGKRTLRFDSPCLQIFWTRRGKPDSMAFTQ